MRRRAPGRVVLEAGGSALLGAMAGAAGHGAADCRARAAVCAPTDGRMRDLGGGAAPRGEVVAVKARRACGARAAPMREQLRACGACKQPTAGAAARIRRGASEIGTAQLEWVAAGRVPQLLAPGQEEQIERVARLRQEERELTRRIERHNADDALAIRAAVPNVACWCQCAAAELIGSAGGYTSGRQFAAWKGLAPRLSGTGGKVRPGAISKRGDPYVRTLLIHGARSVIAHQRRAKRLTPWLSGLLERRPLNVAVVALANKMARTAWALAAHGRTYRENYGAQAAYERLAQTLAGYHYLVFACLMLHRIIPMVTNS